MQAERTGPLAGVVLAAGMSSRMGQNKLVLEIEGETLLRRTVGRAIAAGLDPVIVVVGHEAARARAELSGLACEPVFNPLYEGGIYSSLAQGIFTVPESAGAAVVVLADMPFVTTQMLLALMARYRDSAAPLVASQYGEVFAPPILYDRSLFEEILTLGGDGCGKKVVKRHQKEAVLVSWPAQALTDVDVPADYEWVKGQLVAG